jgi:hypothetical protein
MSAVELILRQVHQMLAPILARLDAIEARVTAIENDQRWREYSAKENPIFTGGGEESPASSSGWPSPAASESGD